MERLSLLIIQGWLGKEIQSVPWKNCHLGWGHTGRLLAGCWSKHSSRAPSPQRARGRQEQATLPLINFSRLQQSGGLVVCVSLPFIYRLRCKCVRSALRDPKLLQCFSGERERMACLWGWGKTHTGSSITTKKPAAAWAPRRVSKYYHLNLASPPVQYLKMPHTIHIYNAPSREPNSEGQIEAPSRRGLPWGPETCAEEGRRTWCIPYWRETQYGGETGSEGSARGVWDSSTPILGLHVSSFVLVLTWLEFQALN